MFDIGWGELVIIGVVALIVIGPKELPAVLRTLGQWMAKIRRMAAEFQGQFHEAMREAEMADLKKQVDIDDRRASTRSRLAAQGDGRRDRTTSRRTPRRRGERRTRRRPRRLPADRRPQASACR